MVFKKKMGQGVDIPGVHHASYFADFMLEREKVSFDETKRKIRICLTIQYNPKKYGDLIDTAIKVGDVFIRVPDVTGWMRMYNAYLSKDAEQFAKEYNEVMKNLKGPLFGSQNIYANKKLVISPHHKIKVISDWGIPPDVIEEINVLHLANQL